MEVFARTWRELLFVDLALGAEEMIKLEDLR
jgi:hypothetical protein